MIPLQLFGILNPQDVLKRGYYFPTMQPTDDNNDREAEFLEQRDEFFANDATVF